MALADTRWVAAVACALALSAAVNVLFLQESRRAADSKAATFRSMTGDADAMTSDIRPPDKSGAPVPIPPVARVSVQAADGGTSIELVRGVQRELNARSYNAGQADGVAGLVTRAAIMAYEHDYNLPLTAVASEALLSRIVLGSSATQASARNGSLPTTAEAETVVRAVKLNLGALGYGAGKADATLDAPTEGAIRQFERDQKLGESGRISGPLMSRLLRLQGGGAPAKVPAAKPPKR